MSTIFSERYKALNKEQRSAVEYTEGPLLVLAGPGTGKTELIALRIGQILKNGTAKAENILCLTFTETASLNMRDRLLQFIGPDAHRVAIYTFHGFCTEVMGRYPEYFYNASRVRPASDLVQSEILESIFERLPHKHPLGAYHAELGFSYLKDVQKRIQEIKRGGFTPERFIEHIEGNIEVYASLHTLLREHLPERIGKTSVAAFEILEKKFDALDNPLAHAYRDSIRQALARAKGEEGTKALSAWKSEYTTNDGEGKRVVKDFLATEKLLALGEIYRTYQERLYAKGCFDYEDMIIEVVEALVRTKTLATELEEQFQYIMVDEFQDTNLAQLTLVKALSSSAVHEGRANVCVVGDDDQAVYKFQGAETSNISRFKELYTDVKTIILRNNYRSTQEVLTIARALVTQGKNRLENVEEHIRKDLVAKNTTLSKGTIAMHHFDTDVEEYSYVASRIHDLIKEGEKKEEIAVIAREHKQLRAILPYLDSLSIPYTYTREENVFDEQHVRELITICRYLGTAMNIHEDGDYLLPEILAFPFWGLDRISIWEIAERAKREQSSWLASMRASKDTHVQGISEFLTELSVLAKTTPLEVILDTLIGSREIPVLTDDEHDDMYEVLSPLKLSTSFTSPYKEFYFGKDIYKKNPSGYIHFLSSLRVFVRALREYKDGEMLYAHDVGSFVDMHTSYSIPLINNTPFAHNEHSVSLLTSHGAKGLEFAHVFIISAHDSIWAGKGKVNKIRFPITLPLSQSPDDEDDFIRLFYVALTRARHSIVITYHENPFRFLEHDSFKAYNQPPKKVAVQELLTLGLKVYHHVPFARDEKALLKKVLDGYQLSPTHLNNFLNIVDGGPMKFLEQNLLRFPQGKHPSSVYGTAIHKAIEDMFTYYKKHGNPPALSHTLEVFEKELRRGRLVDYEEEKALNRGRGVLQEYYQEEVPRLSQILYVELDFKRQGVVVGGAHLTGKIDCVLEKEKGIWEVVDIKTGKAVTSWDGGKSIHESIKIHAYRQQLLMYMLLVEHSRDYKGNTVQDAVLRFVEEYSGEGESVSLTFSSKDISKEERERFANLVAIVYRKIMALDFPDTSTYEPSIKGIHQFEEDLLAGRI